ncbi:MAG TPA: hypothetical protein VFA28_02170, partial [Bryobacteraceae bacterium]|nr:hypothetical protein [Bryobacteraceae bacterium]
RETQSARRKLAASQPRSLAATASPLVISASTQFVSSARVEPLPDAPPSVCIQQAGSANDRPVTTGD